MWVGAQLKSRKRSSVLPGMDRMIKKAGNNQEKETKPQETTKRKSIMEIKTDLHCQSCRKRVQHTLYQFLVHTDLIPTDPGKSIFRFRVKKDCATSPMVATFR